MISSKFSIYTKKQKRIIKALDVAQVVFGLLMTGLAVVAMFSTQDSCDVWTIIMGIAAIISLVDIVIGKTFSRHTFFHKMFLNKYKKSNALFLPTATQKEVCSWLNTKIKNGEGLLICGKPNAGKTSAIFMFLLKNTKNWDFYRNISWAESIIYIDCKNNKSEIIDFFDLQGKYFNENIYEKSLIVIDNLETMGKSFLEKLLNVINSSLSVFILLADVSQLDEDFENALQEKIMRNNLAVSGTGCSYSEFVKMYEKLTDREKFFLLVIYYISLSVTLIQVQDIYTLFNGDYSLLQIKCMIASLLHKDFLKYFPFDHHYVLISNRVQMDTYRYEIMETPQNLEAIHKILHNSENFPESAWLSLIHLPYEQMIRISLSERKELFTNALQSGNYMTLHKTLMDELIYSSNKEDVLLYELGTLYFYNSQQEKAFQQYNSLVEKSGNNVDKNRIILRIVEATHGDVTPATKKNITLYLQSMENDCYEYRLYAEYWALHIETERGRFPLEKYGLLLKKLNHSKNDIHDKEIYFEVVKRCYTDIIRSYHILAKTIPETLFNDFNDFLHEVYPKNNMMHRYYDSLYVKANTLHYIELLDDIINGKNCQSTYDKAILEYDHAIACGYENFKSVSACELKAIDLKLFNNDNISDFQEYERKINKFLSNAEINKVHVHVAYCKTLLAKLYMIRNLYDTEYRSNCNRKGKNSVIKTYLREARKVYDQYQNMYGVIRIDILELLYHIATVADIKEINNDVQKMADILEKHQEYQREINIICFFRELIAKKESFAMSILSLIKAYPIIMQ